MPAHRADGALELLRGGPCRGLDLGRHAASRSGCVRPRASVNSRRCRRAATVAPACPRAGRGRGRAPAAEPGPGPGLQPSEPVGGATGGAAAGRAGVSTARGHRGDRLALPRSAASASSSPRDRGCRGRHGRGGSGGRRDGFVAHRGGVGRSPSPSSRRSRRCPVPPSRWSVRSRSRSSWRSSCPGARPRRWSWSRTASRWPGCRPSWSCRPCLRSRGAGSPAAGLVLAPGIVAPPRYAAGRGPCRPRGSRSAGAVPCSCRCSPRSRSPGPAAPASRSTLRSARGARSRSRTGSCA